MPRKHTYAQHFIRSPRIVAELVGHSNLRKNDLVYDLGAGSGVITSVLASRVRSVVAVEIEPNALRLLRKNTSDMPNVTLQVQDILRIEPPAEPYKIFSNIPFSLSSPIIQKFLFATHPPKSMYLIVQKQFAKKIVPGDDHFTGQLSAEISPWFTARIRKPLRRTDFTPPPGVDTALLELKRRENPLIATKKTTDYREFIARCFQNQKYFGQLKRPFSSELRPSQLTTEQWVALYSKHSK